MPHESGGVFGGGEGFALFPRVPFRVHTIRLYLGSLSVCAIPYWLDSVSSCTNVAYCVGYLVSVDTSGRAQRQRSSVADSSRVGRALHAVHLSLVVVQPKKLPWLPRAFLVCPLSPCVRMCRLQALGGAGSRKNGTDGDGWEISYSTIRYGTKSSEWVWVWVWYVRVWVWEWD